MAMRDGTGNGQPRGFTSISSAPIAAVGFVMALYLYELHRMSSLRNVTGSDVSSVAASLAPVAIALLLALVFNRRPTFRLHRHTVACFAVAGVMAASVLYTMNASIWPVNDSLRLVVSVVLRICETLLLLCWGGDTAAFNGTPSGLGVLCGLCMPRGAQRPEQPAARGELERGDGHAAFVVGHVPLLVQRPLSGHERRPGCPRYRGAGGAVS